MKECFIYTSGRSKTFIESSRKLESLDTRLPVQYKHSTSETKCTVPISEKKALRALQKELLKYPNEEEDYDVLRAAFSPLVPGLKSYWDEDKLHKLQENARSLMGNELGLLRLASEAYETFVDESKMPVLYRHHTLEFPQLREWYLCDQQFIPSEVEYDKVHIFAFFEEVSLTMNLRQILQKYSTAEFHLIVMTQLDLNTYMRILSNYLGFKLDCKVYLEVSVQ